MGLHSVPESLNVRPSAAVPAASLLQRKAGSAASLAEAPSGVNAALRSTGQPLDRSTQAFMEQRFQHDFSQVRVHLDHQAAESARSVQAQAYTSGRDIVFSTGRYAPHTQAGRRLIAHELAHVIQQAGASSSLQSQGIVPEQHSSEGEAESAAQAVLSNTRPRVAHQFHSLALHRHKDDLVAYTGGQSGSLVVIQAGKLGYVASAVSGHPGHGENEPGVGPIPAGKYVLHPKVTRSTVAKAQSGVCGANGIASGYQEITSKDASPCSGAHYCNVPCPTPDDPARQCFTPQDCWGPMRIKIEGRAAVVTPEGKKAVRDGFYIHGGNPKDAVSSGCIKSLDNGVFAEIRKLDGLKGAVPLCVGAVCDEPVKKAFKASVTGFLESVTGDNELTMGEFDSL